MVVIHMLQIGFIINHLLPITALAYPVQVAKNGVLKPKGQLHITDILSRGKKIKKSGTRLSRGLTHSGK